MGITALPNPPNSGNPATFNDDADTFLGALPTMVTEINALLPSIAAKLWATVGAGSAANALVLSCGFPALAVGTQIRFRATATNTGPTTLNLDGLGAKACRTVTGVGLPAGYIRTDADTVATYDGTYWVLDRVPEYGSNANGEYVRFADGTQICTMIATTSTSGMVSVTFPVAFQNVSYRCSFAIQSITPCVATISSKTTSGLNLSCWDLSGALVAKPVELTIRSRWF